jgi:hypothetical protein
MKKISLIFILVLSLGFNAQAQLLKKLREKLADPEAAAKNKKNKELEKNMKDGAKFGFLAADGTILKSYNEAYGTTTSSESYDIYFINYIDLTAEGIQHLKVKTWKSDPKKIISVEHFLLPYSLIHKPEAIEISQVELSVPVSESIKVKTYKPESLIVDEKTRGSYADVGIYSINNDYDKCEAKLTEIAQKLSPEMQAAIKKHKPTRYAKYQEIVKAAAEYKKQAEELSKVQELRKQIEMERGENNTSSAPTNNSTSTKSKSISKTKFYVTLRNKSDKTIDIVIHAKSGSGRTITTLASRNGRRFEVEVGGKVTNKSGGLLTNITEGMEDQEIVIAQ